MKQFIILCYFLASSMQANSCQQQSHDEIKAVVNEFVQAMHKPVKFKKMKEHYVDFPFYSVVRVDEHEITSIKKEGTAIIVEVHSFFVKHNGKKMENDFSLKLEKREGVWKIINSKKLSSIKGAYPQAYDYALKQGLINEKEDIWDVELHAIVKKAKKMRKKN